MEIRNRLFPYPVLCDETDDYNEDTCDVTSRAYEGLNDIRIRVDFQIQNHAILDLIREGSAEYAVHIECTTTSFRKLIRSDVNEIEYSIPKSRISGDIAVLAAVIAKRRIRDYYSDDLNDDYQGTTISFDRASILAYRNMPRISVYKNYEELAGNESLFSIIKVGLPDDDEIKPLTFDLSHDRIQIMVDPKTYEAYIHYQQIQAIAMSLLVLPALIYMIEQLRVDWDSFSNKMWFIKMLKFYKGQELDFRNDVIDSDRTSIEIAQEMLKSPIGTAYRNLMEAEV